jgi:hypothetical protein
MICNEIIRDVTQIVFYLIAILICLNPFYEQFLQITKKLLIKMTCFKNVFFLFQLLNSGKIDLLKSESLGLLYKIRDPTKSTAIKGDQVRSKYNYQVFFLIQNYTKRYNIEVGS